MSGSFWTHGNCLSDAAGATATFVDNHGGDIMTGVAAAGCVGAVFDLGVTSAGCLYLSGAAFAARVNQRRATEGWCGSWQQDVADLAITTLTLGSGAAIERGLAGIVADGDPLLQLVKTGISVRAALADLLGELPGALGEHQQSGLFLI